MINIVMMHNALNMDTMIVSLITTTLYATMATLIKQIFDFIYEVIERLFIVEITANYDFARILECIIRKCEKSTDKLCNNHITNNNYIADKTHQGIVVGAGYKREISKNDNDKVRYRKYGIITLKNDHETLDVTLRSDDMFYYLTLWRWQVKKFLRIAEFLIEDSKKNIKDDSYNETIDMLHDGSRIFHSICCSENSYKLLSPVLQKEYEELKQYMKRTLHMKQIGNGEVKRYFIYGPPGGGKTHFATLVAGLSGNFLYIKDLQKTLMEIYKKNEGEKENNNIDHLQMCKGTLLFDNVDASDLLFKDDKDKSQYGNMATLCDILEGKLTPDVKVIIMVANVPEDIPPEVRLRMRRGRVDKIIYVPNTVTKEQCIEFIKFYDSLFVDDFNIKYVLNNEEIDKVATKMIEENLTVAEVNEIVRSCIRTPFNNWLSAIENEKEQKKFSLMNFDDVKSEIKSTDISDVDSNSSS